MNSEMITSRLQEIESAIGQAQNDIENLVARRHMLIGAKQELLRLLRELENPKEE